MFAMDNGNCFPAEDALAERFDLLVDGTSTVFSDQNQTINMRVEVFGLFVIPVLSLVSFLCIQWPGYNGWVAQVSITFLGERIGWTTFQIRIVNYQGDPKGINRAKLVKEIAKQLKNFIEVRAPPHSSSMQRTDYMFRKCSPPSSILDTSSGELDREGSNCVISTSLHWSECRVVRGSHVSSTTDNFVPLPYPIPLYSFVRSSECSCLSTVESKSGIPCL